jgi:hypothetical protein
MSESSKRPTISTPELRSLVARGEAKIERFVSTKSGRAEVQLVSSDGRRRTAIVVDPS